VRGNEEIGSIIRSSRTRRGWTQSQLAEASNVSVRTIREMEAGRTSRPHPHTLRLLRRALDLPDEEYAVSAQAQYVEMRGGHADAADGSPVPPVHGIIGREDDVSTLCGLVRSGERLITVTGIAGVGKTALAAMVARTLAPPPGGRVRWIHGPPQHPPATSPGRKETLELPDIVIIDGAGEDGITAILAQPMYSSCQVLITAHRPLGLPGEWIYPLAPLAPPVADGLSSVLANSSVKLLSAQASRLDPRFTVTDKNCSDIARICRLLDGIPALLIMIGRSLHLIGLQDICAYLIDDISHAVRESAPDIHACVAAALARLDPPRLTLLRHLAERSCWAVSEVTRFAGNSLLLAAREVRELLEVGVIRPCDGPERGSFEVLLLVRSMLS
jgi:DNA-binding XRE family transcriptional regulator